MTAGDRRQDRRDAQRDRLVVCAREAIAANGLATLRARALAECVGCSVGAIYNLVADLDELILLVAQGTMAQLNARLEATAAAAPEITERFVAWANAYLAFAAEHRNLWRALFEFRLPPGRALPDWFEADQRRLFLRLEDGLAALRPTWEAQTLRLRARTLFSAVHGIVALGLEEKIVAMPTDKVATELESFVRAYLDGMPA